MVELTEQQKTDRRRQLREQLIRDLERMYPGPVRPRGEHLSYSLAKKATRYGEKCVSESHPADKVPAAERGSWLCRDCEERFRTDLIDIEQSWPILEGLLRPLVAGAGDKVDTSMTGSPAPIDVAVSDVMGRVRGWVRSLIEHLAEDLPGERLPDDQSTVNLIKWVRKWHTSYVFTHPCSSLPAALVVEVAELVRDVNSKTSPSGTRRLSIPAGCTAYTTNDRGDRVPCPGELSAVLRDRSNVMGAEVQCSWDSTHDIPQHEWLGLLKRTQQMNGETA